MMGWVKIILLAKIQLTNLTRRSLRICVVGLILYHKWDCFDVPLFVGVLIVLGEVVSLTRKFGNATLSTYSSHSS